MANAGCARFEDRLWTYLDREQPPDEERALRAHLDRCPACRESLARACEDDRRIAAFLEGRLPDADGIVAGVMARIEASQVAEPMTRAGRGALRWVPLVFTACLALEAGCLIGIILMSPPSSTDPQVASPPVPVGRIVAETGGLKVAGANERHWWMRRKGETFADGSTLAVPEGRKAEVHLADGTVMRLNSGACVQVRSRRVLELAQGEVFLRVQPSRDPFVVQAGGSSVRSSGAEMLILRKGREVRLGVFEGMAHLQKRGRTVLVRPLELALADGRGIVGPHGAPRLRLALRWTSDLLVLADTESLERHVRSLVARLGPSEGSLATQQIRVLGPSAVPGLVRAIASAPIAQWRRAALARLAAELATTRDLGRLVTLLDDDNPHVRLESALGLHRLTGLDLGFAAETWTAASRAPLERARNAWRSWLAERVLSLESFSVPR